MDFGVDHWRPASSFQFVGMSESTFDSMMTSCVDSECFFP